jgi:hypothetical protein
MRIGRDDNFILIETVPMEGGHLACRIEAVVLGAGRRFSAVHDRVMLDASAEIVQRFTDFEELKSEKVEIPLTEGGWLRFDRDKRGHIIVHYRISGWKVRAAMEGQILLEAEFSGAFCHEFRALFAANS